MLYVYFGNDKNAILSAPTYFNHAYYEEWFEDDFVKQMILDIDKTESIGDGCFKSPVLGYIPAEKLSGGVKTLICLYMLDDFYPDLVNCGENCCKWLYEISKKKDIRAALSGFDLRFIGCEDIEAVCLNDNTPIKGRKDWCLSLATKFEENFI